MSNRRIILIPYFILKHKQLEYLEKKVNYRNIIHTINVRRKFDMEIPKHKSEILKDHLSITLQRILTPFNRDINLSFSLVSFKQHIKNNVLNST